MKFITKKQFFNGLFAVLATTLGPVAHAFQVEVETVPVGDPGNAADDREGAGSLGFGAVPYEYHIGKYPVTNAQYAAFLNAVAATDTNNLYHTNMGTTEHGGITRSGSAGNYTYSVRTPDSGINAGQNMANRPVHILTFYSAARFANWLMNGQPTGAQDASTTEDGFYTFDGRTNIVATRDDLRVDGNETFWVALPTEDEWYKAAYFNPTLNDGAGGYNRYPTRNDTVPVAEPPPGGANSANFGNVVGTVTDVGAYVDTYTHYGAYDMGGNVWERNDTLDGTNRGRRGGTHASAISGGTMLSTNRYTQATDNLASFVSFRIASSGTLPGPVTESQTLAVRESTEFEEFLAGASYEGDVIPDNASPAWARVAENGGSDSVSGGALTMDMFNPADPADLSARLFYRSDGAPGGNFWEGDFDTGFTVEVRLWVEEVYDAVHGACLFTVRNGGRGGQAQLQFRGDSIRWWNGDVNPMWVMAEGEDHTQGYQTIRMVKMPEKNEWHVWRDGVLIGAHMRGVSSELNELIFGDTSDIRYGGKVHIDYVRWDTTGAYAPSENSATIAGIPSVPADGQVVRPAVELEVGTMQDVFYRIQSSPDLMGWNDVTPWRVGSGAPSTFLFTMEAEREFYRLIVDEN